jgi:hypothetical protein
MNKKTAINKIIRAIITNANSIREGFFDYENRKFE